MKKKRPFTLLEIMIVIFLIGLIGGIVSYSMKGSLAEGKAFKTTQAMLRIRELLELELARGATPDQINGNIAGILEAQGVVKNAASLLKDGWGETIEVKVKPDGEISTKSAALNKFKADKDKKRGYALPEE